MREHRTVLTGTLFCLFTTFLAFAAIAAPEWCARPLGAATTDAMWASIQPMLPYFRKIAGGDNFAVISTPKLGTISGQADAYRNAFRESAITTFLGDKELMTDWAARPDNVRYTNAQDPVIEAEVDRILKKTGTAYSRQWIRIALAEADSFAREETETLERSAMGNEGADYVDRNKKGEEIGVTYVYSPARSFQSQVNIEGIDHGATLLTTGDELKQVYENPAGFRKNLQGIKYIFVDNIKPGVSSPLEAPDRMIARLPALAERSSADIIDLVHGKNKQLFVAFSLLPEAVSAAAPWKLDEHLTRSYAAAGKQIAGAIRRARIDRGTWSSATTLAAAVEKAVAAGARPMLIGESAGDGKVRLAGTSEIFDPAVLSDAARQATYYLFCNSSDNAASRSGFSIEGRIYSNTVARLIGTLAGDGAIENSRERAGPASDWISALVDALSPQADGKGSKTVTVYKFTGVQPTPAPTPTASPSCDGATCPGGESMPYLLLYGAFGGVCSEYFRWRALLTRPRAKAYQAPVYIMLSIAFVLLAGGVGFVLGRLAPTGLLQSVSAFVAGVGLEEVVKRAARLQRPNVPFDQSGIKASLHEFVAG